MVCLQPPSPPQTLQLQEHFKARGRNDFIQHKSYVMKPKWPPTWISIFSEKSQTFLLHTWNGSTRDLFPYEKE